MTDRLTIVNWCHDPADACDPCNCHWVPAPQTLPLISDPGHPDDDAIDKLASFCGVPVWGMGLHAASIVPPGEIVDGYIDVFTTGRYVVFGSGVSPSLPTAPTAPAPVIPVLFGGVPVFVIDPSLGVSSGFSAPSAASFASGPGDLGPPSYAAINQARNGIWSENVRVTFPNCVMLDATEDRFTSPYNCALPYTGPIPDIAFSIAPSCVATTSTPLVLVANSWGYSGFVPFGSWFEETGPGDKYYSFQSSFITAPPFYLHVKRSIDPV